MPGNEKQVSSLIGTSCIWCLEARGSCQQTAVTLSGVICGGLMKGSETKALSKKAASSRLASEWLTGGPCADRVKVYFPHCPALTGKVQRPPSPLLKGTLPRLWQGIWGCAAWCSNGLKLPTCPKMCAKHSRGSNPTYALKRKVDPQAICVLRELTVRVK